MMVLGAEVERVEPGGGFLAGFHGVVHGVKDVLDPEGVDGVLEGGRVEEAAGRGVDIALHVFSDGVVQPVGLRLWLLAPSFSRDAMVHSPAPPWQELAGVPEHQPQVWDLVEESAQDQAEDVFGGLDVEAPRGSAQFGVAMVGGGALGRDRAWVQIDRYVELGGGSPKVEIPRPVVIGGW